MVTVAIIQARLGSTRLPGKVLADLAGRPLISWTVAAAQAVPGVHRVAVATSETVEDDAIATWCEKSNIHCHRGPEEDVLERYRLAAVAEGAEVVMRLTADCPLLDPQVCGLVLALLKRGGIDYACNFDPRSWPDGLDCEVFTAKALYEADAEATRSIEREHVTPFIFFNRERYDVRSISCPLPGMLGNRWTLDRKEDLDFLRALVAHIPNDRPPSYLEILQVLDRMPELREINAEVDRFEGMHRAWAKEAGLPERDYGRSRKLLARARKSIPLGTQTFSKSHTQYPEKTPLFLTYGEGGSVWDVDANRYVDLVM
ncbi:MAG: NTP transferase domain-containing protein, partial [Proteobacteria bacterium]|nr:NTP transferase domain-containing protein [Pseudomonadota bacterium]